MIYKFLYIVHVLEDEKANKQHKYNRKKVSLINLYKLNIGRKRTTEEEWYGPATTKSEDMKIWGLPSSCIYRCSYMKAACDEKTTKMQMLPNYCHSPSKIRQNNKNLQTTVHVIMNQEWSRWFIICKWDKWHRVFWFPQRVPRFANILACMH